MKRVLVTGATGFLGRAVCEALAGGAWVRATSRSIRGDGPWDEAVRADLGAPLERALTDDVDTILHCAGVAHAHGVPIDDDEFFAAGNVAATRRLCEAAAASGVVRVVLAGSVAVLGDGGPSRIAEDAAPAPASGYARSKLAAERIVRETAAQPVVLRFPLVYGPGLPGNLARMIDAVERRRFPPVPAVRNRRSMIHVQDAGYAMALAGRSEEAAGGIFTVTDGRVYSTREIYEWILMALGRRVPRSAPPVVLFHALACCGDLVGRAAGRRAPFDSDAFRRLFGSAEYAAERFNRLGFTPGWDLARAMPAIVAARRTGRDST